ncbi:DMT family transporter, partial [Ellagibacter isourolithinifaciens]
MRGSSVAKGVLLTAGGAICWGFSGTCAQLLMDIYGVPLAWNVCVRLVFASLLYLVFCAATHREQLLCLLKQPRELGRLLAFSIFGVLLVQVCYQGCISVSNAGTATVFERCGLILIMLITCLKARRAPMRRELLGVVLAIVGTICIATKGNLGMLAIPAEALMWGAASACALVFYTMMPVRLLERWGSVVTTTVSMTMAAIIANAVVQPWNMHVEVTPGIVAAMAA